MADPISAIASAAASWAGATAASLGASVGVQATVSAVTYATVTAASYAGLAALTRPEPPKSAAGKFTVQQTMPVRRRVINRARLAGDTMLKEGKRNYYLVRSLCQGPVLGFHDDVFWFHSDRVTRNPSTFRVIAPPDANPNRYKGNGVWLLTRLGAVPETSFNDGIARNGETFDDLGAGVWPTTARGDGICSLCVIAGPVEQKNYQKYLPFGHIDPSAAPIGAVYDWRQDSTRGGSGSQRLDNMATWGESWNPIVWLARERSGRPEDPGFAAAFLKKIAPQLAAWTQAADDCDDAITLDAGGTEPRYRTAGGWYFDDVDPVEVAKRLLATCDGYMLEMPGGSVHVEVGKERSPTFTLPWGHVKRLRWVRGAPGEAHKNHFDIKYCDLAQDFSVVPGDPWRNEADIALNGKQAVLFEADWVPSHAQARRLAKIAELRGRPTARGTVTSTLLGMMLFFGAPPVDGVAGRRFFNLERRKADGTIVTVVAEVASSPRWRLAGLSIEWDFIVPDPGLYDWNEATEEGAPPPGDYTAPDEDLNPADWDDNLVSTPTYNHLVRWVEP